ncbi:MAG: glucose-6-phosphate dehydrogenase, partial [Gammaproteobacteria bacterium HGW-Gammaproteobacteria-4]
MHETLLLFGATGDLAQRYLFQSLLNLLRDRLLPPGFRVYAIARQDLGTDGFRASLGERLATSGAPKADIAEMLSRCEYVNVDLADPQLVAERLAFLQGRDCVSYLSTPPSLYVPITQGLKAAGLLDAPSRLVLEKPIGRDLASARDIMSAVGECVSEDRVFRIDHYLGKAPVQNLLALRFGNALLEAVWHHRWIA